MGECPLCRVPFDDADAYRRHLGAEHGLFDDPGTRTELPPEPQHEVVATGAPVAARTPSEPARKSPRRQRAVSTKKVSTKKVSTKKAPAKGTAATKRRAPAKKKAPATKKMATTKKRAPATKKAATKRAPAKPARGRRR